MKRTLIALSIAAAVLAVAGCGRNASKKAASESQEAAPADTVKVDSAAVAQPEESVAQKLAKLPEEPVFDIITSMGTIRIKLYSNTPKHRENFAKLALEGYYDGTLFHRVINGFMIQGGDPLTKDLTNASEFGTGGPGYTIPAEIRAENVHKKGALAAARRGDAANPYKESSGSQFYIVQDGDGCMHLNGEYTVFGETIDGLDVIDSIASVETNRMDCPVVPVKIITVKLAE